MTLNSRPISDRRVYAQDTEPSDERDGVIWVDTSDPSRTVHVYSADAGDWVNPAPESQPPWDLIASVSDGTGDVTISFPPDFERVKMHVKFDNPESSQQGVRCRFNGDTSSEYRTWSLKESSSATNDHLPLVEPNHLDAGGRLWGSMSVDADPNGKIIGTCEFAAQTLSSPTNRFIGPSVGQLSEVRFWGDGASLDIEAEVFGIPQ